MSNRRVIPLLYIICFVLCFLAGCGAKTPQVGKENHVQSINAQIEAIKSNSHMPPQAKAMALAQLQQHDNYAPVPTATGGAVKH